MPATKIPALLTTIKEHLFDPLQLEIKKIEQEKESEEYSACRFNLNELGIIFRNAKTTPAKTGQFVTIWKRNHNGITQPYELTDTFDFMMITASTASHSGIFIFPKLVLLQKDMILGNANKGKRGTRVYPSWDKATSKQAEKTQKWQLEYFIETTTKTTIAIEKARKIITAIYS